MTPVGFWTPPVIERLREMVAAGMSANKIAREMGATKNAVIAKCHRLGLQLAGRNHIERREGYVPRPRARDRSRVVPTPPLVTLAALSSVVAAMSTPPVRAPRPLSVAACCWPTTSGRPWRFCERAVEAIGHPYCCSHSLVAHVRRSVGEAA